MIRQRMPELALHFAVPFALTAPVLGLRKATLISLLALTPDLDVLFHMHRSASHSIFLLLLASLLVVDLGLVSRLKRKQLELVSAGCLALLSHPIMDIFSTYTPILYPLIEQSVYLKVELKVTIGSPILPILAALINTKPTTFEEFQRFDAPLFSSEGFIVTLLLVAVPLLVISLRHARASKRTQQV